MTAPIANGERSRKKIAEAEARRSHRGLLASMVVSYGSQSMSDPLRRVFVRRPDASFGGADPKRWGYQAKPNLAAAQREHDGLVDLLKQSGVEVRFHEEPQPGRADSIFVHDPAIVTDRGALILRMGKELRRGEEAAMAQALGTIGIPVLASLQGDATAEGGDLLWVNHDVLAMAPNVLAVAPRDCIMLEGNPVTQQRLTEAGCHVRTYRGNEISLKAEGGATCLTRPILRSR